MQCPVRAECLADALDNRISFGVWGGMTERERRALLRRRPDVRSWAELLAAAREDYLHQQDLAESAAQSLDLTAQNLVAEEAANTEHGAAAAAQSTTTRRLPGQRQPAKGNRQLRSTDS